MIKFPLEFLNALGNCSFYKFIVSHNAIHFGLYTDLIKYSANLRSFINIVSVNKYFNNSIYI